MNLLNIFRRKPEPARAPTPGAFSTDIDPRMSGGLIEQEMRKRQEIVDRFFQAPKFKAVGADGKELADIKTPKFAMDASNGQGGESVKWQQNMAASVPFPQLLWYANQTFIGYQLGAIMAQNWLINKCCWGPPRDAVRHGWDITINNGEKASPEQLAKIRELDKQYGIRKNLIQYASFGRIFGIRVAMFKIKGATDEFYQNPFNIDGIKEGSYEGISQIDPYWITPELNFEAGADPSSIHFYEPTWWRINGKRIHRTHLMIYRPFEVADILKPVYWYGGIPLTQLIAERVYAAERVANEAPMLSLSKRTRIIKTDAAAALANQQKFDERMQMMAQLINNFGTQILDRQDEVEQFDTTLSDFDDLIMTQYQLVCAASNYPSTKLLGTSPKGFSSTGEYEENNYHEELETMQMDDLQPLLERHYALLSKSHALPKIEPVWNPVDSMSRTKVAEYNYMKSQTAVNEAQIGAIDGIDERDRLTSDKMSGYNGLEKSTVVLPVLGDEDDEESPAPNEE